MKITLKALAAGLLLAGASAANASDAIRVAKVYAGADLLHLTAQDGYSSSSLLGLALGYQFNSFWGVEAHYGMDVGETRTYYQDCGALIDCRYDVNVNNYGIGITGQLPISGGVYLKGLVGVDGMSYKIKQPNYTSDGQSSSVAKSTTRDLVVGKIGIGYEFIPFTTIEATYTQLDKISGFGVQLKHLF